MLTPNEIKAALDSLGTLGLLTIGNMPASPDIIGVIYEYGGRVPEGRFGVRGIGYERPAIQVVFRGVAGDYNGPRTKAEIAWKFLAAVLPGQIATGSAEYLTVKPQQSPFPTELPDANNRIKIGFNCYVTKEPSS